MGPAGFQNIKELAAGETDDEVFRAVESRSFGDVGDVNRFETLVYEATRPPAASAMNK